MENTQVGPFMVLTKVGAHRRHNVYHARQTEQGIDVALKFIKLPADVPRDTALAKINHESQVIKRLKHDNVVKLFGAGTHEDQVFFAHALVEGESLYALLTRLGRMAPDLVIDYGAQLASALDYLHHNELIHNNLSTDKVMITSDGVAKLTDVRLNRPRKRRWDAAKRATLETAAYMSPEQLLGEGSTDRSDVYSLGVMMYEMVTGKLPFDPKTMGLLARDKQTNKVTAVTDHVMNCPAWLGKLIMQMIQADSVKRPHSAKAVQLTLEQIRTVDQSKSAAAVEMTRGFSALTAGKDQAEARKLLGKQPIKEKKLAGPLMQSLPFLIGGLVLISMIVSLAVFWPFGGTPVDRMTKADTLMKSNDPDDWRKARSLYEKIANSSADTAEEAAEKYKLSRRKSMLFRLDRGVTGLDKVEIREFYAGYELEKQHKPEEALAFYQRFVDEYDLENRREYVYDEAKERLQRLSDEKQLALDKSEEIEQMLEQADQLAVEAETVAEAREIWQGVIDQYGTNDFLLLSVQRAENAMIRYPIGEELSEESDEQSNEESRELEEGSGEKSDEAEAGGSEVDEEGMPDDEGEG